MQLTTTDAATWTVAVSATAAREGSTTAIAAGTATALPAVVATPQAAYPGRRVIKRSHRQMNAPPINTVVRPRMIPEMPP